VKYKVPILYFVGVLVIIVSLKLVDANVLESFKQLISGSMGSAAAWKGTLREMSPLLLLGAAVYLALKAGLFNIGAEGQFLMGACFASITMLAIGGPLGMVLGCLVGALSGGLWALPAGWIKAYRNGHEVITTIMLNNIALNLTKALVSGPYEAPGSSSSTAMLTQSTRLTPLIKVGNFEVGQSLLVGILATIGLGYWLSKTVSGYELRASGANPTAAEFAGVKTKKVTMKAMLASGALAGLAGALQVSQFEHRFYDGFSPGYGFDALGVALLAGGNPIGLLASSLFFGVLNKGGASLSVLGIDKGITTVILAVVILMFAAVRYGRKAVNHG
jgi:general nucleoside transport system permease protein